jgi:hypothetical protein
MVGVPDGLAIILSNLAMRSNKRGKWIILIFSFFSLSSVVLLLFFALDVQSDPERTSRVLLSEASHRLGTRFKKLISDQDINRNASIESVLYVSMDSTAVQSPNAELRWVRSLLVISVPSRKADVLLALAPNGISVGEAPKVTIISASEAPNGYLVTTVVDSLNQELVFEVYLADSTGSVASDVVYFSWDASRNGYFPKPY